MATFFSYTGENVISLQLENDTRQRVFWFGLPDPKPAYQRAVIGSAELMERLLVGHTIIPATDEFPARLELGLDIESIMQAFGLLTPTEAGAKAEAAFNRGWDKCWEHAKEIAPVSSPDSDETRRARAERSRVICGND